MPTTHAAIASMSAFGSEWQYALSCTHLLTHVVITSPTVCHSFLVGSSACYIACWLILLRASSDFLTQDAWILVAPLADALSPKPSAEHATEVTTTPVPVPYAKTCRPKRDATPASQPAKGSQGHDSTQSAVKLTDKGRGRGGGMGRGRGRDRGRGGGRGRGKHRAQTGNLQETDAGSMIQGKSVAGRVSHCVLRLHIQCMEVGLATVTALMYNDERLVYNWLSKPCSNLARCQSHLNQILACAITVLTVPYLKTLLSCCTYSQVL